VVVDTNVFGAVLAIIAEDSQGVARHIERFLTATTNERTSPST
jgi:hypothetical protein